MERIDHIDILQVRRSRLIGHIHRMFQRHVPDREGLKFRVADIHAAFGFIIHLAQAGGQLAAAGTGRRHHDNFPGGFDIGVLAVAFFADDCIHVGRVSFGGKMFVHTDAAIRQLLHERVGGQLVLIARDDHAVDRKVVVAQIIDDAKNIRFIGDPEIAANFVPLDVPRINADDDFQLIGQMMQQLDLGVRIEARQYAFGMQVGHQFAAEFEV